MPVIDRALEQCRRISPLAADAGLAAIVGLVTVISVVVAARDGEPPLTVWGGCLLALQIVPLVWRRRAPVAVMLVVTASTFFYGMASLPDPPIMFAAVLTFYTVASHLPRRESLVWAAVVCVAAAVGVFFGDETDAADVAVGYFAGITAWVVGDTTRGQRERTAWLEQRRADETERAIADERMRIARDLHDIVAHRVSVIAVQAEAAQEVLNAGQTEAAGRAVANISETSRTALSELRRLLGVLRSDTPFAPQPSVDGIDELAESMRTAGVDVAVRITGTPRALEAVVGLTAYRVVQEALTNVLKHAGRCQAHVDVEYAPAALLLTVDNDRGTMNGSVPGGAGAGLTGMHERLAMLGGTLETGPLPGGGFRVKASIPA